MSDKSNEQISNLMDGELEVNASQFLLKRMAADKSLSKTWENYHLIKSCLQKEEQEPLVIDIVSRVSAELGLRKPDAIIEKPVINKWLKPVIGFSIAASVAFMSVLMVRNQQVEGVEPNMNIAGKASINQPLIKPSISANYANGGRSFVSPPTMLSRFPSVTAAKNTYNQDMSASTHVPYMVIIDQSVQEKRLSPMKNMDVGD